MALRFGRKVRLMGSEQMTRGGEEGREREKLSSYDKVSFLGYVTDDSTDRTDSVVRRWIR